MPHIVDCPCGKAYRKPEHKAGTTFRCHECGRELSVPLTGPLDDLPFAIQPLDAPAAPLPRPAPAPAAPALDPAHACPECGTGMAPEAVLCVQCGFNRQTGQRLRAAIARPARTFWPDGTYPVHLLTCVVLFPLGALACVTLMQDPIMRGAGMAVWGLLLLLIGGNVRRLTVTRDAAGRPVLRTRQFVCFIPLRIASCDLGRYGTIRLGYSKEVEARRLLLGFLALGILGILILLMKHETFTVEVTGVFEHGIAPDVEPLELYRGPNERVSKALADALKEIAGLRYG